MLSIYELALQSVSETFLKLITKNNTVDVYYLNYLGHSLSGLESVLFRSVLRVAVFLRHASTLHGFLALCAASVDCGMYPVISK